MVKRARVWAWFVAMLVLAPLAGCGGERQAEAKGELTGDTAKGAIALPGGGFLEVGASPARSAR